MLNLLFVMAIMSPGDVKFNISLPLASDCKIYVEMPCKEIKPRRKILNPEQFKKYAKHILFQEYVLFKLRANATHVTELHFRLLTPEDRPPAPKTDDFATVP